MNYPFFCLECSAKIKGAMALYLSSRPQQILSRNYQTTSLIPTTWNLKSFIDFIERRKICGHGDIAAKIWIRSIKNEIQHQLWHITLLKDLNVTPPKQVFQMKKINLSYLAQTVSLKV